MRLLREPRERLASDDAFPESFEEGLLTDAGPSSLDLRRLELAEDEEPAFDLLRDRGGRIAGGGKGGGFVGKIGLLSSPRNVLFIGGITDWFKCYGPF